jgi:ribulose-phosphate 3-epimerase
MTVNPGWGGQAYIEGSERKVQALRRVLPRAAVEVDGGIDATTATIVSQAGARLFVAGSAIFGADDPAAAYRQIAESIGAD